MNNFLKHLKNDKIKINWNKNPIKMDLFLSFLKVETEISTDHLGYSNGWTLRVNKENNLYIRGGIVGGVDYLDSIKFGENLQNQCNHFVNPFYILHLMNEDGRKFFVDYYKSDINELIESSKERVKYARNHLKKEKETFKLFSESAKTLRTEINKIQD